MPAGYCCEVNGVIWGLGDTKEEALEEARKYLKDSKISVDEKDIKTHPVTPRQYRKIDHGETEWPL